MKRRYPETTRERDHWILTHRPARNLVDARHPYAFLLEEEPAESGGIVSIATIFLTNRECPWRCLMCDLWRNTLTETVPLGAIPAQIDYALAELAKQSSVGLEPSMGGAEVERHPDLPTPRGVGQIKLYNSGSFFDPRAVPVADHEAIANRICSFDRVIVECHPALVNQSCVEFQDLLWKKALSSSPKPPRLEIAMGLETVHPETLERLNKHLTLDQFARAAEFLGKNEIGLRVFILVKPPFQDEAEGLYWAERSLDFAFQNGVAVAALIPTRGGNGALEALAEQGQFSPPKLSTLEEALRYGLSLKGGRTLADLWDLERFSECSTCFQRRAARLHEMNLRQTDLPPIPCEQCHGSWGQP